MECNYCSYEWKSRISKPKSCPRCKRRFDYEEARAVLARIGKELGYDLVLNSKENKKVEEPIKWL
jgi:hypothetical protein